MEIERIGFPELGLDNDETFLSQLLGVIESIDELSHIKINKAPNHIWIRVAPSNSQYLEPVLYEILKFSNIFGIRLQLSKSMKTSGAINFEIETNN